MGGSFFQRGWSILRSVVNHYSVMIHSLCTFGKSSGFSQKKIISLTLTAVRGTISITIISGAIYYHLPQHSKKSIAVCPSKS